MTEEKIQELLSIITPLEQYVRQYSELLQLQQQLDSVLCVDSTRETATHMAVRLASEREINGRKEYLAEFIAMQLVEFFREKGTLSQFPELHTSHNEK